MMSNLKSIRYICIDPIASQQTTQSEHNFKGFVVTDGLQKTFMPVKVKLDSIDGKYKAGQTIYISSQVHNSAKIVGKIPDLGEVWLIPEDIVLLVDEKIEG